MELREALKDQYHAGLAMLAQCVERCPDDLWTEYHAPRQFWRAYWRIVFHNAFYTHLYLGQNTGSFVPCPGRKEDVRARLWAPPFEVELYELPENTEIYSKSELLAYVSFVDELIDSTVDQLDLDTDETGFPWYPSMTKLPHELMNLRHLQGHIGQLSELLMERDIDTDWIGKRR